ncbi:MAG: M23 family metallopeptidase [Caldilineaceae bacterium]|nr:M23 family metallopeptidase [Caldilineaceae bacterium]
MKVISFLFGIWALFVSANFVPSPKLYIPLLYSPPLSYMSSGGSYGPYPFTKFGVQNPDLPNRDTCFSDANGVSIKWPDLFHAGTDWFALSGKSAASEPVTAIADGFIEWVSDSNANYPGSTIIIRHVDPELGTLYSVYMHLIYPSKVQIGDVVNRGAQIGEVITQTITLIDGSVLDNSHLHWEARTFADATQQTWFPQACDGSVAGEGYTKDDPTQYGYIDPDNLLSRLSFLPLVRQDPTSTPAPTATVTPTPTKTPTPTPTATPTPTHLAQSPDSLLPYLHHAPRSMGWLRRRPHRRKMIRTVRHRKYAVLAWRQRRPCPRLHRFPILYRHKQHCKLSVKQAPAAGIGARFPLPFSLLITSGQASQKFNLIKQPSGLTANITIHR